MSYDGAVGTQKVTVIYDGALVLDPLITSVVWDGDIMRAYRSVTVSLVNTINGETKAIPFELGKELSLVYGQQNLFRGVIMEYDISANGDASLVAYDENFYLTRNSDSKVFRSMTASAIIKQLLQEFDIEYGHIEDTGYVIPKLILRNKTLWDMCVTALTETDKQVGRRYLLTNNLGKVELYERNARVIKEIIDSRTILLDASYSQSIEDMSNRVKVMTSNDGSGITKVVSDNPAIEKYGLMQHVEITDSDSTQSEVDQKASELLKKLSVIDDVADVTALGIIDVIAGTNVYVKDAMTGIIGSYYVQSDRHEFSNGTHKMTLTLSYTDEIPTLEYVEPVESSSSSSSSSNGTFTARTWEEWKQWAARNGYDIEE